MERAWAELKRNISLANRINKTDEEVAGFHAELNEALRSAVTRCRLERKRKRAKASQPDLSDDRLRHAARFTDNLPLADYAQILNLVPRLVNVVTEGGCARTLRTHARRQIATAPNEPARLPDLKAQRPAQLAEAVPVPGSGLALPLDLHSIAARCTNAYYAPRRFAAVQLAFNNQRCRVLIFREQQATAGHAHRPPEPGQLLTFAVALVGRHRATRGHRSALLRCSVRARLGGRVGGLSFSAPVAARCTHPGCSGPMQARVAILKAVRQLAVEANVHVHVRKFAVINQAPPLRDLNTRVITSGPRELGHAPATPRPATNRRAVVGSIIIGPRRRSVAHPAPLMAPTARLRACAGWGGLDRRQARLRRLRLDAHGNLALRPRELCRPRVAAGRRKDLLRCVAHDSIQIANLTCFLLVAEIYSTGKANLPGSTRQRDLLSSFARMVGELLRHSNRADVCERVPERLRLCHRPQTVARADAPGAPHSRAWGVPARQSAPVDDLFAADGDWALGPLNPVSVDPIEQADEDDLLELSVF